MVIRPRLLIYDSVADMLERCKGQMIAEITPRLLVRYEGKYLKIASHEIKKGNTLVLY